MTIPPGDGKGHDMSCPYENDRSGRPPRGKGPQVADRRSGRRPARLSSVPEDANLIPLAAPGPACRLRPPLPAPLDVATDKLTEIAMSFTLPILRLGHPATASPRRPAAARYSPLRPGGRHP